MKKEMQVMNRLMLHKIQYVMFLFGMSMLGAFAFVPFYFEDVRGNSAIISGFKIFPMVIGVMICSTITGVYISKTGKYIIFPVLGMTVFSTGIGLCILMATKTNYWLEALYLFVVGGGMGFSFPVYNAIVQNSVAPQHMASTSAALVFIRQIGGCIGISIFGTLYSRYTTIYFNKYGDNHAAEAQARALHIVFYGALICSLLAFLFSFGIKNVQLFARQSKVLANPVNNSSTNPSAVNSPDGTNTVEQQQIEMMVHAAI